MISPLCLITSLCMCPHSHTGDKSTDDCIFMHKKSSGTHASIHTHTFALIHIYTQTHQYKVHQYSLPLIKTSIHPFHWLNHVVQGLSISPKVLPEFIFPTLKDSFLPGMMAYDVFTVEQFLTVTCCMANMTATNENHQEAHSEVVFLINICKSGRSCARIFGICLTINDQHCNLTE